LVFKHTSEIKKMQYTVNNPTTNPNPTIGEEKERNLNKVA